MSNIPTAKKKSISQISGDEEESSRLLSEDHIPRMIINDSQNIIFCNQSLSNLCGNIEGANICDIFSLEKEISVGQNNFISKKNKKLFFFSY